MTIAQKINMAIAYKGISQAALARAIGMTPSNFNQKFKRETFTQEELEQIAEALGGVYVFGFEFPDGTKIQGGVKWQRKKTTETLACRLDCADGTAYLSAKIGRRAMRGRLCARKAVICPVWRFYARTGKHSRRRQFVANCPRSAHDTARQPINTRAKTEKTAKTGGGALFYCVYFCTLLRVSLFLIVIPFEQFFNVKF